MGNNRSVPKLPFLCRQGFCKPLSYFPSVVCFPSRHLQCTGVVARLSWSLLPFSVLFIVLQYPIPAAVARTGHSIREGRYGRASHSVVFCRWFLPLSLDFSEQFPVFCLLDIAEHQVLGVTPLLCENGQFRVTSSMGIFGICIPRAHTAFAFWLISQWTLLTFAEYGGLLPLRLLLCTGIHHSHLMWG